MKAQDKQRWSTHEIEWLFFDFFGTLYRMVPTPLRLCQQLVYKQGGGSNVDCSAVIRIAAVADNAIYRLLEKNPRMQLDSAMKHLSWQTHLEKLQELTGLDKEHTRLLFQGWHNHWSRSFQPPLPRPQDVSPTRQDQDQRRSVCDLGLRQ